MSPNEMRLLPRRVESNTDKSRRVLLLEEVKNAFECKYIIYILPNNSTCYPILKVCSTHCKKLLHNWCNLTTVVSYQNDSVSSKLEVHSCSLLPSMGYGDNKGSCHFDGTPNWDIVSN